MREVKKLKDLIVVALLYFILVGIAIVILTEALEKKAVADSFLWICQLVFLVSVPVGAMIVKQKNIML